MPSDVNTLAELYAQSVAAFPDNQLFGQRAPDGSWEWITYREFGEAIDQASKRWRITLQVGLSSTDGWEPELTRLTERFELLSAATTRRGAAMEMVYRVLPKEDCSAVQIVAALNAVPSVESVTAKAN